MFHNSNLFQRKTAIKAFVLLVLSVICITIQPGSATIFTPDGNEISGAHLIEAMNNATNVSSTPFPIHFFYNTHCGSCQGAIKYLGNYSTKHPDITIQHHDLFNNTESFALYEEYKKQYNRSDLHYPVIFMGNIGIMGSEDIENYTELLALWYQKHNTDPIRQMVSILSNYLPR
jgi:glutaredoxin